MKKSATTIILISSLLCGGCVPVAITAVGATAVVERDNIKKHFSDGDIAFEINNQIAANRDLYHNSHIVVAVSNGNVLLVGEANSQQYRDQAESIAKNVDGVKRVYDQINLSDPISFWQQSTDSMITTKVKARIFANSNAGSGITVVTENNVVYLMGVVTTDQADAAAEVARTTDGVTQVVKVFQYITAG